MLVLPRLYPILDAAVLERAGISIEAFARGLRQAGVRFLQYRDKQAPDALVVERARLLRAIFPATDSVLFLNDRAHLVRSVPCDGVHLGQEDRAPEEVRAQLGGGVWIGLSTHNEQQLLRAERNPVDYVAVGPVYATRSKQNPDPVIGLEGVKQARALTQKPLVAIGGITAANAAQVIEAGADAVAVILDLLPREGERTGKRVEALVSALSR